MKEQIIKILNQVKPGVDYENEKELISNEVIASFDLIMLVSLLNNEFDINISVGDLIPENFENIESIEKLINSLK